MLLIIMSLPDGWVQQQHDDDDDDDRSFWVDTWANPPRAIWIHPYEDDQFLSKHPELDLPPPSYDAATRPTESKFDARSDAIAGPSSRAEHKRGVFGRLKDKAIGTQEERQEQKRIRVEQAARAEELARQARTRQRAEREAYMRAHGGYAPYHPSYSACAPGPDAAALVLGGLAGGLLLGDVFGGL